MNDFKLLLRFLFRHFYGKYQTQDTLRMGIGLFILAGLEITLLEQTHMGRALLEQPYIIGSLIAMNVYMTILFVLSQWRGNTMELVCTLPIPARSFWTAEVLFIMVDTCLRRTLFFLILPVFLTVRRGLPIDAMWFGLGKFLLLTFYSVTLGVLLANLIHRGRWQRTALHGVVLAAVGAAAYAWEWLYLIPLLLHASATLTWEYPQLLEPVVRSRSAARRSGGGSFSFYRREWIRFLGSKPMLLNYVVLSIFAAFFCYNFVRIGITGLSNAWIALAALLLSGSPSVLLYSIEKNNRTLLLTLPIRKSQLFGQKYLFCAGLLLLAYCIAAAVLILLLEDGTSFTALLRGAEVVAAGVALRLKSDERRPIMDWAAEQKLWNDSRKYYSYLFCIPLLLLALLPTPFSNLAIPLGFFVLFYGLSRKEGGFFA
ncbi:hypothetical protein B9G55_12195 [Saccharibacillus sp. O16]|nr:hypothetical protein B9G55_12195 [Saccharibacillus sp. O16]